MSGRQVSSSGSGFDFRDLLGKEVIVPLDPDCSRRLVVGAAASANGLALAALCEGEIGSARLESYAHVVIGPIEDDWEYIASLVDQVRAILEPPLISKVYLRLDLPGRDTNTARIHERLRCAFPTELVLIEGRTVTDWCGKVSCEVRLPDIPEDDVWTRDLLRDAAQTVLYAELGCDVEPRQEVLASTGYIAPPLNPASRRPNSRTMGARPAKSRAQKTHKKRRS